MRPPRPATPLMPATAMPNPTFLQISYSSLIFLSASPEETKFDVKRVKNDNLVYEPYEMRSNPVGTEGRVTAQICMHT